MLSMQEPNFDSSRIQEEIQEAKASFRKYSSGAFERVLSDYYKNLRNAKTSSQEFIANSLTALQGALNQPELIDQVLLIGYISELVRFVENAGFGLEFGKEFIDRAIDVYSIAGYSLIDLYLAKARFLRLDRLENPTREMALKDAEAYAQNSQIKEDLVKVLIALTEYYTDISRYDISIRICEDCENIIKDDKQLSIYYPKLMINLGINYYYHLLDYKMAENYLLKAKENLEMSNIEEGEQISDWSNKSNLAICLHYLGRVAEAKGNLLGAMNYYIEGEKYQQMCPEDLSETAFFHLRLGELLTSAKLLNQARDHIQKSQEIFDKIQYESSGRIQVALAWASIYNKEGNYKRAREYMIAAREDARQKKFPRGELLCLVKLFWLDIKYFRIHRAIYTFFESMKTLYSGELERNHGLRLIGKYVLQVVLTPLKLLEHSPHTILGTATFNSSISSCTCPIHLVEQLAMG
jgi:tetratricopeptide (TPR) repeat protein